MKVLIDFNKEFRPSVERAPKFYFDPRRTLRVLKTDVLDYLEFLKTLPEKTQNLLQKIEKRSKKYRRNQSADY